MQLVFVCSGNTCRSPLALCAWHLAVRELGAQSGQSSAARLLQRIKARSAGLCATIGAGAAPYSQEVARGWGEDLTPHRAQLFRPEHARFDLIITMTHDQSAVLRSHFEVGENQVRRLGSYAPRHQKLAEAARFAPLWNDDFFASLSAETGSEVDILDPYGGSLEAYEACASQIRRCVFELARTLSGSKS
ncbi:Protein-tyrosine-phosphatase [Abditibacterium utsteinense]|uniref:protein-tyrosine-phosphatase n=1 Tax=Abditibacterium utsteinense TaxID=1960156 RepID=A0A2S8SW36_9BACT|nr:hypothetical protein [Abditibacterium utsteinense]PQV64997.1 Protein-tyrosine-phosphatase [Abditibacterium utsteinense]